MTWLFTCDKNADALGALVTKNGNFEKKSQTSP
jgi:hypothetical protein